MKLNVNPKLIGVYQLNGFPDVSLIEIKIDVPVNIVDISSFMQPNESLPKEDWQVAYDEHFLNEDGTKVIGTMLNQGILTEQNTRVAFFMHYVNFNKPLISQYGEIKLSLPTTMPERLECIIHFDPVG